MNIFRIERHGEAERFASWSKRHQSSVGDRRLLWHGSQRLNFIGILSLGLSGNPPPTRGQDRGIYLAEMARLSINFCLVNQIFHHPHKADALMLLCEVECGKNQVRFPSSISFDKLITRKKYLHQPIASLHKWRDASSVHPDLSGIKVPDFRRPVETSISPLDYIEEIGAFQHDTEYIVRNPAQIRQRYLFHLTLRGQR